MASKSDDLIPILLLAGLAAFLLMRRARAAGGASGQQATQQGDRTGSTINALTSLVDRAAAFLGGATGGGGEWSGGSMTIPAWTDQVLSDAAAWQNAYGGAAGADGDPYWSE